MSAHDPRNVPGHAQRHAKAEAGTAWAAKTLGITEIPGKPYEVHVTLAGNPVPDGHFFLGGVQLDGSTDDIIGSNIRQAIVRGELVARAVTVSDAEFEELCRRADEPPVPEGLGSAVLRAWREEYRAGYLAFERSPEAEALARRVQAQYGGPGQAVTDALREVMGDSGPAELARELGLDLDDPGQAA